jgi:hypothetical protein
MLLCCREKCHTLNNSTVSEGIYKTCAKSGFVTFEAANCVLMSQLVGAATDYNENITVNDGVCTAAFL